MATTAGALTQVTVGPTTANLSSAAATGGTAPYTYQWYRSTTTGFSPGAGSLIDGATSLTLADSGLIPNTPYFYKVVATDSGAVTGTSAQLAVTTTNGSVLSPNQFTQSPILGMVDQKFNFNTQAGQIDLAQTGTLYAGTAVKMATTAGGAPKYLACTSHSDVVQGFVNFNVKDATFVAGSPVEISSGGNVIYLYATTPITRGAQVSLAIASPGSVQALQADGSTIVGYAYDGATAYGQLIRVYLQLPGFTTG